ncbi:MAG: gamma-glutamyl-gamma-aminobutyrate hydrolase family protein [Candidatus Kerfeldbacteria bacterium]
MICIIDCGTVYLDNIKSMVRMLGYSCNVIPLDDITKHDFSTCSGIIISGGTIQLTQIDAPQFIHRFDFLKDVNVPVLGICLGHQIIGMLHGSTASKGKMVNKKEAIHVVNNNVLFSNIKNNTAFRAKHAEAVTLPDDFVLLAKSESCDNEAMKHASKDMYGVLFRPEVSSVPGVLLMINFLSLCADNALQKQT